MQLLSLDLQRREEVGREPCVKMAVTSLTLLPSTYLRLPHPPTVNMRTTDPALSVTPYWVVSAVRALSS